MSSKCNCSIKFLCENCKNSLCLEHSIVRFNVTIALKQKKLDYFFCCGACLFAWNLKEAIEQFNIYGSIDSTWIPVIRQLRKAVNDSIKEAILTQDSKGKHIVMTFESTDIIKILLVNDGIYPGDPQVHSIYKYQNKMTEKWMYAVFMADSHFDLDISPYVGEFKLLWQVGAGLTEEGKKLLSESGGS